MVIQGSSGNKRNTTATLGKAGYFQGVLHLDIIKDRKNGKARAIFLRGMLFVYQLCPFQTFQFNFKGKCEANLKGTLKQQSNIEFWSQEASVSMSCLHLNINFRL